MSISSINIRNRHFGILDFCLLLLTPILALMLRLDGWEKMPQYWLPLLRYTLLGLAIKMAVFYALGLYRRYWRYASVEELVLIVKAVAGAMVALTIVFFLLHDSWLALPRSLPFIDSLLTLGVIAGPRFAWRVIARRRLPQGTNLQRVIIVGAGDAGQMLAREMRQNPSLGYDLVGFIDDDESKQGLEVRGVAILGGRERIPELVREARVQQVIIAIPSASGATIRQITQICNQAGVQTRILPGFADMLNGEVDLRRLRPVQINDLLRREPIETDISAVQELIRGQRVLVTGAGGSIGRELCRQIWRCGPSQMILVGHGENSIFEIYHELRDLQTNEPQSTTQLTPCIADIRFPQRIRTVFERHRPQIVFHAAAHKHVPLMEANPAEAITNNVLGTRNLVEAALAVNVERFVMISTDKAVNPTSIMGASKRAAELIVHAAARQAHKPYVAVRFGNVLGSRGSVVLTFQRQIAERGPVTVTHPDMQRYFMTIPEAVQLVLQASVLATDHHPGLEQGVGATGKVFVLDMGKPVKIVDLARDLIELSGLEVGRDIDIVFTGRRPGEKLFEELFVKGEHYERTRHEKIFIATNASSFVPPDLDQAIEALALAARRDDKDAILLGLRNLIPEFTPVGNDVADVGPKARGAEQSRPSTNPGVIRPLPSA